MIAFGPVPSRRLGQSLGINNIPPKRCTYACIYCQLGPTLKMQVERQAFYGPDSLAQEVQRKVEQVRAAGEAIDYLSFVPDGEPTLDLNLGREIELLRPLGIPLAVISNSSLIGREDVRHALLQADWVSLKVDAVQEETWHKVDRPHGSLRLEAILDGALQFAASYQGELTTETMLVAGVNDGQDHLTEVAEFLARLQPAIAYLAVPTRPPAEEWVHPPAEEALNHAYQILSQKVERVEYLIGYEGNAFASTGKVAEDLLSITAVHPMRQEAVDRVLARTGADGSVIRRLVAEGQLAEVEYRGDRFYVRKLSREV